MHDVGKSVLDRSFHDRYLTLIGDIYNGSAASFADAERAACGFDHAVVGGLVAQKWNLAPGEAPRAWSGRARRAPRRGREAD